MKIIIEEAQCCPVLPRKCYKHIKFYVATPVNMALHFFLLVSSREKVGVSFD